MPSNSALLSSEISSELTDQEKVQMYDALVASLANPETVLVGMLRGYIAKLSARGISKVYGQVINDADAQLVEIAKLRAELAEVHQQVPAELRARCIEILNWKRTGVLEGNALRAFAARQTYAQDHAALVIAETDTAREAFELIAAGLSRSTSSLMREHRIAVTPEYEGQWHAHLYADDAEPVARADGDTPEEAVTAVVAAYQAMQEQQP